MTNAIALARRLGAERETLLVAGYDKGLNRAIDVSPARLVVLGEGDEPARPRLVAARRLRRLIRAVRPSLVMSMGPKVPPRIPSSVGPTSSATDVLVFGVPHTRPYTPTAAPTPPTMNAIVEMVPAV